MKLKEILKNVNVAEMAGPLDVEVNDIAYHAGAVSQGGCFVAIVGSVVDGHNYVDTAIQNGASVIISGRKITVPEKVANVVVASPREALAKISSNFFGNPSERVALVGITGTNGKTTITYLLESIWKACGYSAGVVGTVNCRYGTREIVPKHTTPESYDLQKLMAKMADSGVTHVAMEVSSHSLDQGRVGGCQFDGAIFTNITQDHLDYHLDMERYKAAKTLLFNKYLATSGKKGVWAAVNIDDPYGNELASVSRCKIIAYSLNKDVDVFAKEIKTTLDGMKIKAMVGNDFVELTSLLIGRYNASNILAAVSAGYAMGLPLECVKRGVENLQYVPGRLEPVKNSKGLHVLVDYAHTPDALKNVTGALKELKPARLITVFGCGGDRDKAKRPLMGHEVALRSDVVIVTNDNPRSENPRKIIDEILGGIKQVGLTDYMVIENRREAIEKALGLATKNDVVLIAGKGHENYQIIGNEKLPFDDAKVATEVMETF